MTIKELADNRAYAAKTQATCTDAVQSVKDLLSAAEKLAKDDLNDGEKDELYHNMLTLGANVITYMGHLDASVCRYIRLLDGIMERTQLDWPPVMAQVKE